MDGRAALSNRNGTWVSARFRRAGKKEGLARVGLRERTTRRGGEWMKRPAKSGRRGRKGKRWSWSYRGQEQCRLVALALSCWSLPAKNTALATENGAAPADTSTANRPALADQSLNTETAILMTGIGHLVLIKDAWGKLHPECTPRTWPVAPFRTHTPSWPLNTKITGQWGRVFRQSSSGGPTPTGQVSLFSPQAPRFEVGAW